MNYKLETIPRPNSAMAYALCVQKNFTLNIILVRKKNRPRKQLHEPDRLGACVSLEMLIAIPTANSNSPSFFVDFKPCDAQETGHNANECLKRIDPIELEQIQ